jgi:predicted Ser/Thr protein kinase
MFIEEMEILIECKRLVEDMLGEKQTMAEYMEKCGKDPSFMESEIERLQMALSGKRAKKTMGYGRFNKEDK